MQRKALEGIKVLDFTWIAAGPLTTRYLADLGATVVKVESLAKPDGMRTSPPYTRGISGVDRSLTFAAANGDKLSISINLKRPEGLALAKRLVAWADIVAENMRPGAMEKLGLGYEDLRQINPSIIMFRSSIAGQEGPDSRIATTGTELQGFCGFTELTGFADRDPSPPWGAYTDLTVPALGAAVLVAALDHRAKTGKGQCLDLSQYEASLHFLGPAVVDYWATGRCATRMGNASPYAAPHGVYRCAGDDRWCTIAVFDDQEWGALCNAMGRPEIAQDPRFATLIDRKRNEDELNAMIEDWTVQQTPERVMMLLQEQGISAGVVENASDLLHDPQLKERGFMKPLTHPTGESLSYMGLGFQLSKTPYDMSTPSPGLGEHTEYVCRNLLGMSDDEFVDLISVGALD